MRSSWTESTDLGHVAQVDGRAAARADDQVACSRRRVSSWPCGLEECGARRTVELAGARYSSCRSRMAPARSSIEMPRAHIADGSALIRMADLVPKTTTWLTPGRMLMRWPTWVFAVVVELARRHRVAGQRDVQDRLVVGVRLGEGRRRRQVDRQAAGRLR